MERRRVRHKFSSQERHANQNDLIPLYNCTEKGEKRNARVPEIAMDYKL
jgi:hypothetical protein